MPSFYELTLKSRKLLLAALIAVLNHQTIESQLVLIPISIQGDSGGLGLGYVDINSVSFGGYPETELS